MLFSCGPSKCDKAVLKKQSNLMVHHRSAAFLELYESLIVQLKQLCDDHEGEVLVLNGSGSSGMEAALLNFLSSGEELLVIDSGRFGSRFALMAKRMDMIPHLYDVKQQGVVDTAMLEQMLSAYPAIKAIAFTYSDTSTGLLMDPKRIGAFARKHQLLSIMDGIGGVIMNPFSMKESQIDVCIMASQKGFWMSPGLCMIALSPTALTRLNPQAPTYVFHFYEMLQKQKQNALLQYTPAVSLYFALHQALCILNSRPITYWNQFYQRQYERLYTIITEANGCIKQAPSLSRSVLLFTTSKSASRLQQRLEQEFQIRIELGLDDQEDRILRIGNMARYSEEELNALAHALKCCLQEENN